MGKGTIATTNYKAFDKLYTGTQNAMWKLAEMAFELSLDDLTGFRAHCINDLAMSKGTVSKLISSGEIISEMKRVGLTTNNYSVVYELNPVKEQMDEYSNELANTVDKPFSEMTLREVRESVKHYFGEDENTIEEPNEPDEEPAKDNEPDEEPAEDNEPIVHESTLRADLVGIYEKIFSMSVYKQSLKNDILTDLASIIAGL